MAYLIEGDYRAYPRIGQSSLKRCYRDPQLYYQTDIAHTREPEPSTAAQILGQDIEDFLLTGKVSNYTLIPKEVLAKKHGELSDNGSRAGKAWLAFEEAHRGQRLLKRGEVESLTAVCQQVARNVAEHEIAYQLVMRAERKKVAIAWDWCGLELKSELDIVHPARCIVDIKTCEDDVSPESFVRQCVKYRYQIQGAAYQLAWEQLTGELLPFILVPIRTKPSYPVECYKFSEKALECGRRELEELCQFYGACKERNEWRSATWGTLTEIELPVWYEAKLNDWSLTE